MSDLLTPYVPGRDGPFGFDEAAHLARRAGFSRPAADIARLVASGLDAALDELLREDEGDEARALGARAEAIAEGVNRPQTADDLSPLQAVWIARMAATRAPAREKLALFWHGHFATSVEKVRGVWMWRQYRLFREKGAGSFRELLLEISRDPAMLVWLDSNSNEKGRPNENYAREIMELFSLGIGQYREKDIREAARAFSGWHLKDGAFWFNARAHDDGEKELFGRRGALDGGDVVDLCVEHQACPQFLATKLLRFYALPEPGPDAVAAFASVLEQEQLAIGASLRRLFASKLFFSAPARGTLIASPIDFCIGALVRTKARASWRGVAMAAADMGQSLFAPPNVKGWDGDRAWINSRTLLERARFATALVYGGDPIGASAAWAALVPAADRDDPARLVPALARLLLQRRAAPETAARLLEFARSAEAGAGETRVRRVAHLILTSPEAQLA